MRAHDYLIWAAIAANLWLTGELAESHASLANSIKEVLIALAEFHK